VPLPPPLRGTTLRAVLRKFPEKVLLDLDAESGVFYARPNADGSLPLEY
jgi:hypothetical protein